MESESDNPRSTSATSSLDPYYFTVPSSTESPIHPLPDGKAIDTDPETNLLAEPFTPALDPGSIDRHDLVGIEELCTPHWSKPDIQPTPEIDNVDSERRFELPMRDEFDDDGRGSPWTIEAVDGEDAEEVWNDSLHAFHILRLLVSRLR